MVMTFRPISGPIWRAATHLSSMAGSSRSPKTGAIPPPSSSMRAPMSRSTPCWRIRAPSRPQACMNHSASPRSIRPSASSSRSTSAVKPACPASTPPAISPTPLRRHRSPWHHRTARWRVSSPSSRWWFERFPSPVAAGHHISPQYTRRQRRRTCPKPETSKPASLSNRFWRNLTHMDFEHVTFDLPHGTFHALQGGDPDGQPTLVLHGFPDHPPTAKAFLAELGRRGRHVVAPWLRGYAPSPTAGPFDFAALTSEGLALIDRWSPGRAVELVGHDWGALITYDACVTAPERIERAVTLAVPHPLTFLSRPRLTQLRRSWYMGLFQLPGSGLIATARDLALIDRLWRQWSPALSLDPALQAELHEH